MACSARKVDDGLNHQPWNQPWKCPSATECLIDNSVSQSYNADRLEVLHRTTEEEPVEQSSSTTDR